jgi:Holliday junction resolvase
MQGRMCCRQWTRPRRTGFASKAVSKASKGRSFEHEVRDLFERAGFSVVRGAASKGEMLQEKVDLICTRETRSNKQKVLLLIVGVQCKIRGK